MKTHSPFQLFKRIHIKGLIGPLIAFSCIAYFIYHCIQGERGILAMFRLKQKLEDVKTELSQLQSQKESLDHKVHLLRSDSLDTDILEERARAVLNFASPDDIIIFEEPGK
jgi:cell division protein FtsB